jgi:hypothetical protein
VAARPARIDVAVARGSAEDAKSLKPFAPIVATYQPPPRFGAAKMLGTLVNPYGVDLKDVTATAVLYDASGAIIGGRTTFISVLPASGQVAVSVDTYDSHPAPAKVLIYPSVSSLTILDLQKR